MISREENNVFNSNRPRNSVRRAHAPLLATDRFVRGTAAEGAPLQVNILGEDLVLFRDDHGRPGLLGLHCSHRGTDLSYGRIENGGIRCIYHGWLYDVCGRVIEQPGEPGGGANRDQIRHRAHPCTGERRRDLNVHGTGRSRRCCPIMNFLQCRKSNAQSRRFYTTAIICRVTKATSIRCIYPSCTNFSPTPHAVATGRSRHRHDG